MRPTSAARQAGRDGRACTGRRLIGRQRQGQDLPMCPVRLHLHLREARAGLYTDPGAAPCAARVSTGSAAHSTLFGRHPLSCRPRAKCLQTSRASRRYLEPVYMVSDPNSARRAEVVLGADCSMCNRPVCADEPCSIFYAKRFCQDCARQHVAAFPPQLIKVRAAFARKHTVRHTHARAHTHIPCLYAPYGRSTHTHTRARTHTHRYTHGLADEHPYLT